MIAPHLFRGTLNQYSGLIFFFPYDIMGVDFGIFLLIGLPIRSLKYRGGSSHDLAGLGINSVNKVRLHYFTAYVGKPAIKREYSNFKTRVILGYSK
jgi:hypothetical protein